MSLPVRVESERRYSCKQLECIYGLQDRLLHFLLLHSPVTASMKPACRQRQMVTSGPQKCTPVSNTEEKLALNQARKIVSACLCWSASGSNLHNRDGCNASGTQTTPFQEEPGPSDKPEPDVPVML